MTMFLTADDIEALTGYKLPAKQRQWLAANGYSFDVRADGRPVVSRKFHEMRTAPNPAPELAPAPAMNDDLAEINFHCRIDRMRARRDWGRGTAFVYVVGLKAGPATPVKIGTTIDVRKRLTGLQNACPVPLAVLRSYIFRSAELAREVEQLCHIKFRQHRLHGEWFSVGHEEVAAWIEATCGRLAKRYTPHG